MRLYFQRSTGEEILLGETDNTQGALHMISDFLNLKCYKSYYTRSWTDEEGTMWFDVGSYTEFFKLKK